MGLLGSTHVLILVNVASREVASRSKSPVMGFQKIGGMDPQAYDMFSTTSKVLYSRHVQLKAHT